MVNDGFWEKFRARFEKGGKERQEAGGVKEVLIKILGRRYVLCLRN
jgi:hypothetical protein